MGRATLMVVFFQAWFASIVLLASAASSTLHVPRYAVDLSSPPATRWQAVLDDFITKSGLTPFIDFYAAVHTAMAQQDHKQYQFYMHHVQDFEQVYKDHYPDALAEMKTLADVLQSHARPEEIAHVQWQKVFVAQLHMQIQNIGPKLGECTSVILKHPKEGVVHMRNWDFGPRPDALGSASVTVDFHNDRRDGHFTCLIALTHITKWTTCVRAGAFSMSLNARGFGSDHERGRSAEKELELLKAGRPPRTEVLRSVMQAGSFKEAVAIAAMADPATSMYVILADGTTGPAKEGPGGVVVTLKGDGTSSDVLPMPWTQHQDNWFLVQTNVDHWVQTSQEAYSSHRRDHVTALLRHLGPMASVDKLFTVLQDPSEFPAGNGGPDSGSILRNSTIASVLMFPSVTAANAGYSVRLWKTLTQSSDWKFIQI